MHALLQQPPANNQAPRYLRLTLQQDLLGAWELLCESGQIGSKARLRREQYLLRDEAIAAFGKLHDSHLKRGFQVVGKHEGERTS